MVTASCFGYYLFIPFSIANTFEQLSHPPSVQTNKKKDAVSFNEVFRFFFQNAFLFDAELLGAVVFRTKSHNSQLLSSKTIH